MRANAMPAAPPQQGQDDGSTAILWVIALTFAILGIIWYVFKDQIITGYLVLKLWEVDFLSFFTRSANVLALKDLTIRARTSVSNFQDMMAIGQQVGTYIRIPFTALLAVLTVVVYLGSLTRMFKRTYSMKSLAGELM